MNRRKTHTEKYNVSWADLSEPLGSEAKTKEQPVGERVSPLFPRTNTRLAASRSGLAKISGSDIERIMNQAIISRADPEIGEFEMLHHYRARKRAEVHRQLNQDAMKMYDISNLILYIMLFSFMSFLRIFVYLYIFESTLTSY